MTCGVVTLAKSSPTCPTYTNHHAHCYPHHHNHHRTPTTCNHITSFCNHRYLLQQHYQHYHQNFNRWSPSCFAMSKRSIFKLLSRSSVAVSKETLAKWEVNFDALLSDQKGLTMFTEFSKKVHASENIEFWVDVNEFRKKNLTDQQLQVAARAIFKTYISSSGSKQININDSIRKDVLRKIPRATPDIFNNAQEKIYILMKTDIYPRFLRDEAFLNLVRETCPGASLAPN